MTLLKSLRENITNLTKAPLKPQQRLFALKNVVLPSLYHQFTLGKTSIGTLRKADKLSREAVRKWLVLPHDVVTPYFHADVTDGGLGIPSLRWNMPFNRLVRLRNLGLNNSVDSSLANNFLESEMNLCLRRLEVDGQSMDTANKISRRWATLLHASHDGLALKMSNVVPQQHRWVADGTKLVSGRDYINMIKLRINALPVRARTTRGRTVDRRCRAGCPASETLNHVIQQCHRTHGARILRHNAIVSYLARNLNNKWTVFEEPKFGTSTGVLKPDLLAIDGESAIVVDASIPSEQADLSKVHKDKVVKYKVLERVIKEQHRVKNVAFTAAIISSRGIWCSRSVNELVDLGVIKKREIKILSTRVLIGGLTAFNAFNKMTSTLTSRTNNRIDRIGIG